jgi:hypothetical protein
LRRRRKQPNISEEEKWKEVYQILFPMDFEGSLPSPCMTNYFYSILSLPADLKLDYAKKSSSDSVDAAVSSYEQYLEAELPPLVLSELNRSLKEENTIMDDKTKNKLIDIIKICQAQLKLKFQRTEAAVCLEAENNQTNSSSSNLQDFSTVSYNGTLSDNAFPDCDMPNPFSILTQPFLGAPISTTPL